MQRTMVHFICSLNGSSYPSYHYAKYFCKAQGGLHVIHIILVSFFFKTVAEREISTAAVAYGFEEGAAAHSSVKSFEVFS